MAHRVKGKRSRQLIPVLLVLLLLPAIAQTAQIARGQNTTSSNQWALSLSIENAQNVSSSTFAPFNQIQLFSTVTYGNASVPDFLVTFKVQGPTDSANPTNITAIGETDAAGIANASFRLPAEAQDNSSVTGTWQATATIQTSNGTLQKSSSFTTQWNLKIVSINTQNQQGQNQTIFFAGNTVTVRLTISDAGQPQQANITLNMQDASGKTVNQTQIENTQINSTSPTQVQANIEIPKDAIAGEAMITAAICSGTYQNIAIPAGENQTTYFAIVSNTAPATTPKPTPTFTENSVSLFMWLLLASGLFTFTLLFAFLRRKETPKVDTQMPSIPPTVPGPTVTTPVAQAAMPQSTAIPTATLAPEITEQKPTEPVFEPAVTQEEPKSQIFNELTKISAAANRIQALEAELKSEKEQLSKNLLELHQKVDDEQKAMMSYFEFMKTEIAKVGSSLADKDHKPPEENNRARKQKNQRSQPNKYEEKKMPD